MAESSTQALPKSVGRDALRIVLFGMPAAGKSSLLGALAQAAQTQEHLLNGRLADPTHDLGELQHRLYEEEPRRTVEEVVPYAVDFEPFSPNGPAASQHLGAVLIDCDGRVANDLLVRRRTLSEDSPEGTLASEVLAADTLLLAVDASAPPDHVDADFVEFLRFLRLLERSRGERSEVGGLPVFLVLTKCDLLAQANDTPTAWLERIEERKRQVEARFNQFLRRKESEEGPLPFGRIDLHLWATSVKRPALAGSPPKPREPYGVAELFRECLYAAKAFRDRRRRSSRRLVWTIAGAGAVLATMVGLTIALISGVVPEPRMSTDLQNRIEGLRANEGRMSAERFRGDLKQLEERGMLWASFQRDPEYASLPEELHQYVVDRADEIQAYVAYSRNLERSRRPDEARNEKDLQETEELLKKKGPDGLALPREDWSDTSAGHSLARRLEDIKLIRRAVEDVEDWYQSKIRESEKLWTLADYLPNPPASINWRDWHVEVKRFLPTVENPPFRPKGTGLHPVDTPYHTAQAFDRIRERAVELDRIKKQLRGLFDLTTALGIAGPPEMALLVIPEGFKAAGCTDRVQALGQAFKDYEKTFPDLKLPDAARGDVRRAAESGYKPLLEAGREVVLTHLREASPKGPEMPKTWQLIRPWLEDHPPDLSAWRVLARLLLRLADTDRNDLDPVDDLAAFLRRDSFEISLKRLTLDVPDAVEIRPDGDLTVFSVSPATKNETALAFAVSDKQRDAQRRVTTYNLRPKDGSALTYRPGDDLTAEIPVRDAENREMKLTWARGRSVVYQFEHLVREPRLHPRNQDPLKGQVQAGIHLTVAPGQGSIPTVPDLVPVVKFEKTK